MTPEEAALLSLDDIYIEVGRELGKAAFGAGERPRAALREAGRGWLQANLGVLSGRICGSEVVRSYRADPARWDLALLIAAVADVLGSALAGVGPVTAAALLAKYGLERVCP